MKRNLVNAIEDLVAHCCPMNWTCSGPIGENTLNPNSTVFVFSGFSSFLQNLKLASHDLA